VDWHEIDARHSMSTIKVGLPLGASPSVLCFDGFLNASSNNILQICKWQILFEGAISTIHDETLFFRGCQLR
jgi:hypothetical protein